MNELFIGIVVYILSTTMGTLGPMEVVSSRPYLTKEECLQGLSVPTNIIRGTYGAQIASFGAICVPLSDLQDILDGLEGSEPVPEIEPNVPEEMEEFLDGVLRDLDGEPI